MSGSSPQPDSAGASGADRAERLLVAASRQGAPLARDFLAELRERTTAEFVRAHAPVPVTTSRRWQMMLGRGLTAVVATAATFLTLFFSGVFKPPGANVQWAEAKAPPLARTSFGEAFSRLAAESYFTAEFHAADGTTEHLAGAADGKLRLDGAEPGVYAIVDRDREYQVNEAANRATPVKADYFYRRDTGAALNPWKILKLDPDSGTEASYQETEVAENNEPLLVSRFDARFADQPVAVEAKLDAVKKLPRELMIWPRTNRGAAPLARFQVAQVGGPGDATKFKVAESLTEDGRIGKVVDSQGLVTLRPLATSRWTPVYAQNTLLHPSDWLRTDNIGANAATVQLAPSSKLILGPGTLVELAKPDQLRVHAGIVQVTASEKSPVTVTGPDGKQQVVRTKELWRVADNKLEKLKVEPAWLLGYAGQVPQETLGSLVALVDGRNVNLSVGYHKVTVDIRDQIARTTIEESFVNHTNGVLEGQFYFPLPQDASISGFGMWIGDKLVEADIVEKGRAREIYETILREKRDPGLLEWAGGNIFKARVYPIPGNSEKRIKITYTQVLPMIGDSYRYSYALQSDLLKQNPLRKLELAVTISSTQAIEHVHSPTHATRNQTVPSAHAARIEFSAQNYTPTRDFEVVTKLADRSQPITLIPHQRDDVGFFMLLFQPPDQAGAFQRELVNDGGPIELLILADTSASMDRASRTRQNEVIGALLAGLAPQDKFNLATVDVDCLWTNEMATAATPEAIKKSRDILDRRRSAGWTNLQKGWESALAQASPGTHIVYVGDGLITRGAIDQANDVTAITNAARDKDVLGHAIAVSSSFEPLILKAIASVGGGSMRNASGDAKPQQFARDFLVEATHPSLRNLKVTFEGVGTAAVYPEVLPNLPAGTQQVVLGRFKSTGADQMAKAIVTGMLEGKPVKYEAPVLFRKAPETGSADDASFIPRLWARQHLDQLLAQGSSQKTVDEIISLSEEYHLMTPYTSLLVLETDADRERFKVKKRFQMRDGERFFHESRKNANYALIQQQIQLAQAWRQNLRQKLLEQLDTLGREAGVLPTDERFDRLKDMIVQGIEPDSWAELEARGDRLGRKSGELRMLGLGLDGRAGYGEANYAGMTLGGVGGGGGVQANFNDLVDLFETDMDGEIVNEYAFLGDPEGFMGRRSFRTGRLSTAADDGLATFTNGTSDYVQFREREALFDTAGRWDFDGTTLEKALPGEYGVNGRSLRGFTVLVDGGDMPETAGESLSFALQAQYAIDGKEYAKFYTLYSSLADDYSENDVRLMVAGSTAFYDRRGRYRSVQAVRQPLLTVPVPYRLKKLKPRKIESTWPAEAVALIKTLRLEDDLRGVANGLRIARQADEFMPRSGLLNHRYQTRQLYSKSAWLTRDDELRDETPLLRWCDDKERGNQSLSQDMALVRKSDPIDLEFLPGLLNDGAYSDWDQALPDYEVKLERAGENRTLLIAKASDLVSGGYEEYRWLIDTERRVVVESQRRGDGKLVNQTKYGKFLQIGGRWFATSAESSDADGKVTSRATIDLKELTAEQFQAEWKKELAARDRSITLSLPLPTSADAEKRVKSGQGTLEDQFTLLARHYARNQREESFAKLAELEKTAPNKAGWDWLKLVLLEENRRHDEARQLLLAIADRTTNKRHPAEYGIVRRLRQISLRVTGGNEQLDVLDSLRTAYLRFAEPWNSERHWEEARLDSLQNAGRYDEHREYLAQLAAKYPRYLHLQRNYVASLRQAGEIGKAFAWIEAALKNETTGWDESERDQLRATYCDMLESEGRYADGAKYAQAWVEANPRSYDACQRLLAYLVLSGQEAKAFETALAWLDQHVPAAGKKLEGPALFKVQAAVQLLIGEGRNINRADLDPKYLPRLEKLVLQFAGTEDAHSIAWMIWQQFNYRESESRLRVLKILFDRIMQKAETLPLDEFRRLYDFVGGQHDTPAKKASWLKAQQALERRWAAEPKISVRSQYREMILRLADIQGEVAREAALKKFLAGARPKEKDQAANDLCNHWLNQQWTAAREVDSFKMIEQLSSSDNADHRLAVQIAALYRWTDTWVERRREYLNAQIKRANQMKPEALQKLQAANAKQARDEISQRLAQASAAQKGKNDAYARWLQLEHLTLEIRAERKLPAVADQLWSWLGQSLDQKPANKNQPAAEADEELDEVNLAQLRLQDAWQQRLLVSLLHLAARKDAPKAHVERLANLFEDQRQLRLKTKEGPPPNRLNWQKLQYDLLVIRDLPKELLAKLNIYKELGDPTGHWRRTLARVLAELNNLEAAVQQFEELERGDLLGTEDYRSLSVWYHALDEKKKHEAAQVKIYRTQQAWQLDRQIRGELSRWQRTSGPLPEELNPQVLLMFEAILKNDDSPAYYMNTLREFYEVNHDTRMLQSLANAIPGHTAETVYAMLSASQNVLKHVELEAVIDDLIKGLKDVRKEVKTPLDNRALDLLEVLAHRRGAELKYGAGPHVLASVAALERATKHDWLPGEPRHMAQFLASLDKIAAEPLAAAQMQLLESLAAQTKSGTEDALLITDSLAQAHWKYGRRDKAIDLLAAECAQYHTASGGKVTQPSLSHWFQVAGWQQEQERYLAAEQLLTSLLPQVANRSLGEQVVRQRYALYASAIRAGALTSLGRGEPLYRAVLKRLQEESKSTDSLGFQVELVDQTIYAYLAAHDAKIASASEDLLAFSRTEYPPILARQVNGYENSVNRMADAIGSVAGPKEGIRFLLDRADNEPSWVKYQGNDAWSRWHDRIGRWRADLAKSKGELGDIEPRLLKFVVTELKRDLRTYNSRGRTIFVKYESTYFWKEKTDAFALAAEEVLKESPNSGTAAMYIANYLLHGLDRGDRAVEIVLDANRRKLLNEENQPVAAASLLHQAGRYAESIPILEEHIRQIQEHRNYLDRRCELMVAYFQTKQRQALLRLHQETYDFLQRHKHWNESTMARLGRACEDCELYEPAVEYFKEAIAAHATARAGEKCTFAKVMIAKHQGDAEMSSLYQHLAKCYAGLKNTPAAVDAASSAIVVWPRNHHQRGEALNTLRHVLEKSPDLAAYIKILDKETADTKQDKPVVRKYLGLVLQAQEKHAAAIVQYRIAVQLSPGDSELHENLIKCFDALNDNTGAIAQSFDWLDINRRNFDLWQKLGERLQTAEDSDEAERARTSLAEVAPGEHEGHQMLAKTRETQKRLPEAIEQWQKVAEIRKLEPTGPLNVARLQLELKQKDAAAETIKKLDSQSWPERFNEELKLLPELKQKLGK